MLLHIRYTRLTLVSIIFVHQVLTQSTVSFFSFPEFQVLRSCAQSCIWRSYGSVADVIGCPSPWYDACIYDSKQQASVASHVSSCAQSKCSTGSNVGAPTAAAVYTDYCYSAGFTTAGQASPKMSLDLKTSAIAKNVRNCVTTKCTGTEDMATAIKIYTEYCPGAGYQAGLAVAKTTADSSTTSTQKSTVVTLPTSSTSKTSTISSSTGTSSLSTTIPITTEVTVPTTIRGTTSSTSQTPAISSSTTESSPTTASSTIKSGLTTGGIIGVAISAACSVLGLIFGIGFKIWRHNRPRY
ncbi:hypothetical protein B0J14DRAFT_693218 [Halenospora varia]|nr:hypothetical protein B0J14DRAFT_693218 [Halenospora varia]